MSSSARPLRPWFAMRVGTTKSLLASTSAANVGQGWVSARRDLRRCLKASGPLERAFATA